MDVTYDDRTAHGVASAYPSQAITVLNAAGQRIDELKLANYNLTTAGTERLNATASEAARSASSTWPSTR